MLDFTIGLTEGVAWPWPIAVYLFLAGISGGAVAVAICVNLFRGVHLNTTHHEGGDFDRFYYDRSRHDLLGTGPDQSALLLANSGLLQPDFRHEHRRDGASVLYTARFRADVRCASAGNYVRELA